jgi:hypothetical protein
LRIDWGICIRDKGVDVILSVEEDLDKSLSCLKQPARYNPPRPTAIARKKSFRENSGILILP